MESCSADGCDKPVAKGGLCWAHRKRRQRNADMCAPVREYGQHPLAHLERIASQLADTETDEESDGTYKRRRELIRKIAASYGKSLAFGKCPPGDKDSG